MVQVSFGKRGGLKAWGTELGYVHGSKWEQRAAVRLALLPAKASTNIGDTHPASGGSTVLHLLAHRREMQVWSALGKDSPGWLALAAARFTPHDCTKWAGSYISSVTAAHPSLTNSIGCTLRSSSCTDGLVSESPGWVRVHWHRHAAAVCFLHRDISSFIFLSDSSALDHLRKHLL